MGLLAGCSKEAAQGPEVRGRAAAAEHRDDDVVKRAPAAAASAGARQVTFHRDQAGRIASVTLARGAYGYGYDPATGQLAQLTSPDAVTTSYQHDGALLLETRMRVPGAAAVVVGHDYDEAFRLARLTIQGTPSIEHGYDLGDQLTRAGPLTIERNPQTGFPQVTRVGGASTTLELSLFAEPSRATASFAGQPLYEATYTRDKLGRITHMDEVVTGQSRAIAYGYDDADRLALVDEAGQPKPAYRYDPNGNLVAIHGTGVLNVAATHDVQDRILAHGTLVFTHTPSGFLESKRDTHTGQRATYRHDELGNLLGVELPDGRSIEYLVDGADQRVARLVDGELQWIFAYASGLPVARLHPDGTVESQYIYGAVAHVPDVILKNGRTYRLVTDHLGSPRLVVDVDTGEIVQRLDYDVFGRVLGDTSPDFQPFGFAGGLYDVDTGLVHFGARDYDPAIGRWTTKDPSGFAGGDTNLYAYASGDPVNRVDPNGEIAFLAPLVFAAFKGALAGAAIGGGMDLAAQLIESGGNVDCIDWGGATGGAVEGAMWGAAGGALFHSLGRATTSIRNFRQAARGAPDAPSQLMAPKIRGRGTSAPEHGTFYVDARGNVIPTPLGGRITGSPDGRYIQVRDAAGNRTGVRLDSGHKPAGHPDPRAQVPHGHVPGVTNPDGTPWLPVR